MIESSEETTHHKSNQVSVEPVSNFLKGNIELKNTPMESSVDIPTRVKIEAKQKVCEKSKESLNDTLKSGKGSLDTSSKSSLKRAQDTEEFFKRMNSHEFMKKAIIKKHEDKLKDLELKECSFNPKINNQYWTTKGNVHERLAQKSDLIDFLKMEQELVDKHQFEKDCTFHPVINSKNATKYINNTCSFIRKSSLSNSYSKPEQRIRVNSFSKFVPSNPENGDETDISKEIKDYRKSTFSKNLIRTSGEKSSKDTVDPTKTKGNKNQAKNISKTLYINQEDSKISFKKDRQSLEFDYDMMQKHYDSIRKTKDTINKFYKGVDDFKEIVEGSNTTQVSNASECMHS